jgi:DNA-binding GntR family transcriptional regulator
MPKIMLIARTSLHEETVSRLRVMVTEGELLPGARIPERDLCERFGISRTPLREALKVLASEGLVELLPHRGARVTTLSADALREVFEVVGALEALAGELACSRIDEAGLARIGLLHDVMAGHRQRGDLAGYFACNEAIHEAIVAAAGNPQLGEVYHLLSRRARRARYLANLTPERWEQAMAEHEELLAALRARDGARCAALLREHIEHKLTTVVDAFAP